MKDSVDSICQRQDFHFLQVMVWQNSISYYLIISILANFFYTNLLTTNFYIKNLNLADKLFMTRSFLLYPPVLPSSATIIYLEGLTQLFSCELY